MRIVRVQVTYILYACVRWSILNMSNNLIWPLRTMYTYVCKRIWNEHVCLAYPKRILTYASICERMSVRLHTLMTHAAVLLLVKSLSNSFLKKSIINMQNHIPFYNCDCVNVLLTHVELNCKTYCIVYYYDMLSIIVRLILQ